MRCCRRAVDWGCDNLDRRMPTITRGRLLIGVFTMLEFTSVVARFSTISNQKVLKGCKVAEGVTKNPDILHQVIKDEEVKVKVNNFLQASGKSCKEIGETQEAAGTAVSLVPSAVFWCGLAAACCVPASPSEESLNAEAQQTQAPTQSEIMGWTVDGRFTDSFLEKCISDERFEPYLCPISRQIFKNPVVASDGNTYDYSSLVPLYNGHTNPISPLDRSALGPLNNVIPNNNIRSQLFELFEKAFKEFKDKEADVRPENTNAIQPSLIGATRV